MTFELPKLYPITDRRLSGLSHAEQVACLSEGGARLVQLREKRLSPREFYAEALEAMRIARARGVRLIINDRVDIALALGADGVHLGQDDLDPVTARALLGERAVIGFSTHSVEQARKAVSLPVNYVAVGPVFETKTKENPDPIVGPAELRRVRETIGELPLVAIGGINRANARAALDAGANAVAVISDLFVLSNPSEITRRTRDFIAFIQG